MSDETDEQWVKRMLASKTIREAERKYGPPTSSRTNELLEPEEGEEEDLPPVDPNDLSDPRNNELLATDEEEQS